MAKGMVSGTQQLGWAITSATVSDGKGGQRRIWQVNRWRRHRFTTVASVFSEKAAQEYLEAKGVKTMAKRIGFSGGFETRSAALKEASRRRKMAKHRGDKITVPKGRREGFYRIRYEYRA